MKHLMVDIETLDTEPTAVVVSIGAVRFDPDATPNLGESRYLVLHRHGQSGRTISPATVDWWMQQPPAAQAVFADTTATRPFLALDLLDDLYSNARTGTADNLWSHATFDEAILRSLYKSHNRKPPWQFRETRDIRTLTAMAQHAGWKKNMDVPREGVHHNSLDDAKWQARQVCAMFRFIRERRP